MTNLPSIVAGDDRTFSVTVTDSDGTSRDITGWTLRVTVKERKTDPDSDAVITKDITSHSAPTDGATEFTFTSSETSDLNGSYYYDIQITDADGDIHTATTGTVTFTQGVTNRE